MKRTLYMLLATAIFCLSPFVLKCPGVELNSRYATITYHDPKALKKFNKELYMGTLRSMVKRQQPDTIEEEVVAKINVIVEKAMGVLDMYPPQLKFFIVIEPDEQAVQGHFRRLYKIDVNYIAFYSPGKNRVFYSADNGRLRVVAHEIGHVIVENYFKVSPPQRIHEVLAQYAEKHIND
jgi:hypothetical protein